MSILDEWPCRIEKIIFAIEALDKFLRATKGQEKAAVSGWTPA
jgi:hypothetical protein